MNWVIDLSRTGKVDDGMANLFGVILYTDEHPHIKKVLQDDEYWSALNEISGPKWVVYATKAKEGKHCFPRISPGTFSMMLPVWKEPSENKKLLKDFNIESTEKLPLLVIFAEDESGDLYNKCIDIDDTDEQRSYDKLREVFELISRAIEEVSDKYLSDNVRAYHAVGYALKGYAEWQLIKKGFEFWKFVKKFK